MDAKPLIVATIEPETSILRSSRELASTPALIDRVRSAAVKGAIDVAAEEQTVPNHARRIQLANQEIADGDIEFTVNSLWDAYAGQE